MTNLFDDEDSNKKPVGGLARLGALRESTQTRAERTDTGWRKIWEARGGFPFSMDRGAKASILFLDDIRIFAAAPLLIGWVNDGKAFPKIDYVTSLAFNDKDQRIGDCPMAEITGMAPVTLGVVPILDMRPFTTKDGVKHDYAIRPLVIKSQSVLTQLQTISSHHGRSLEWAKMTVSRSMDAKAPASGDTYFCDKFVDPNDLIKKIPNLLTERKRVDVYGGYPRPTAEQLKELLELHINVAKKNVDKGSKITNFNAEAWERFCGGKRDAKKPDPSSVFDDLADLPDSAPKAAVGHDEYDLSDLDNALS